MKKFLHYLKYESGWADMDSETRWFIGIFYGPLLVATLTALFCVIFGINIPYPSEW